MRAVARLGNGAIVLPHLDLSLDEASWQRIVPDHPEHPQYGLKKLLDSLGADRGDVSVLGGAEPSALLQRRFVFISEAMRPAATTQQWHGYTQTADAADISAALQDISLIEAPNSHDEAEAVALILRETVEHPGRTAALVSPVRIGFEYEIMGPGGLLATGATVHATLDRQGRPIRVPDRIKEFIR
jgi:ATP-dependent helicase/nuclease subunit B